MAPNISERPCQVGFFDTKMQAEKAVQDLQAAGFTKEQLAVICPADRNGKLAPSVPRAEPPGTHGAEALAEGGAIGAAIGGIAFAATALATRGAGLLSAGPVVVGGGGIARGFRRRR